jgi:hypothetical protein
MCLVGRDVEYLTEHLRQRGFESDTTAATRSSNPAATFILSFIVHPLSPTSSLIIGKFSIIIEIVRSILHLFPDGREVNVFSFSGYAEWTKAELLREIARGSWGVISPQVTSIACEELLDPTPIECLCAHPSAEEMSSVAHVASYSAKQSTCASDDAEESNAKSGSSTGAGAGAGVEDHHEKVMTAFDMESSSSDCDMDVEDSTADAMPPIPALVRVGMDRSASAFNIYRPAPSQDSSDDTRGTFMRAASAPIIPDRMDLASSSDDDDDDLPPYPPYRAYAESVRPSRGSVCSARSASNVQTARAASNVQTAVPISDTDHTNQNSKFDHNHGISYLRRLFSEVDEGNIWDIAIGLSIESGDNVIRRSYN